MKNKQFLLILVGVGVLSFIAVSLALKSVRPPAYKTITVASRLNSPEISASGAVHSQDEVTIHFQSGGKLVYLPFREVTPLPKVRPLVAWTPMHYKDS